MNKIQARFLVYDIGYKKKENKCRWETIIMFGISEFVLGQRSPRIWRAIASVGLL